VVDGFTGLSGAIPDITNFTLTSQSDVLDTIDKMIAQTYLYDIETPKETFSNYDLIGKDYSVTARNGVTMLVINLLFQEVIKASDVILSTQNAAKNPTNNAISQSSSAVTKRVQAAAKPVSSDTLTRVGEGVKSSLSFVGDSVDTIRSSFVSGLQTVKQLPAAVMPESSRKIAQSVKFIAERLT
jgi:hypothetical protein